MVSDILFLQKRDRPIDIEPDWVHLGQTPEGLAINSYFVDHPEMVVVWKPATLMSASGYSFWAMRPVMESSSTP